MASQILLEARHSWAPTDEGQPLALRPGQARHSVTVPVWRCWEDGRPPTPPTRSCWRCCGLGSAHTLRRFLLEGGVPEMRTGRAEKPIPSASDPSTTSGRLWTGERRCAFPPNHGDYSAVIETRQARRLLRAKRPAPQDEVGTWNIVKVGPHGGAPPMFF